MNLAQLGSQALRPTTWRFRWGLRGPQAPRVPSGIRLDQRAQARESIDAGPAAITHRFWHGLVFALPFGIAFWAGVYLLYFR